MRFKIYIDGQCLLFHMKDEQIATNAKGLRTLSLRPSQMAKLLKAIEKSPYGDLLLSWKVPRHKIEGLFEVCFSREYNNIYWYI